MKYVVAILLVLSCSGCAMMFRGSTQPIALNSSPDGAVATVDGGSGTCLTPCSMELKRGMNHTVKFHKEGYQDTSVALTKSVSGWLLGDVVIWGPFALLDYTNGAAYSLSQDSLQMTLIPVSASDVKAAALASDKPAPAR